MAVYSPMAAFSTIRPKMPLAYDVSSFQRCQTPE